MRILVTGAAGFIGFFLTKALVTNGASVTGLDNINDYYDPNLKKGRLQEMGISLASKDKTTSLIQSTKFDNYQFIKTDLTDEAVLISLFEEQNFDVVVNLAAQAGVRYSLENPKAYIQSNLVGFANILECCRNYEARLIYASSSSVYGLTDQVPFTTTQSTDTPISLYAATKKSNELMAYSYSHLYGIPTVGLRFFTVYGPWGRPDMAYFIFTHKILNGSSIDVFNQGAMSRDFTYIDDIITGLLKIIYTKHQSTTQAPYKLYNIGNSQPVNLLDFIECIEEKLGIKAEKKFLPLQPGDVTTTWADVTDLQTDFDYAPNTPIEEGVSQFIDWYKHYYKI